MVNSRSQVRGYIVAFLAVASAALLMLPLRSQLPAAGPMVLFVPVVITIARLYGVWPSAFASVLAFLSLDLLFVKPYYHLSVATGAEWIGLFVFLVVAIAAGGQTAALRERERAAVARQQELELLNRLSFRIAAEESPELTAEFVTEQLTQGLGAKRAAIYVAGQSGAPPQLLLEAGDGGQTSGEAALVAWTLHHGDAVGTPPGQSGDSPAGSLTWRTPAEAVPGVSTDAIFLPLLAGDVIEGVLVTTPVAGGVEPRLEVDLLVAIANLAGASLGRQRLAEAAASASAIAEADRLRSAFVSTVSHELKTPLAAATARVTGLIDEGERVEAGRLTDELQAVAEDLGRLDVSIGDLLDLSRIESDAWRPHFEEQEVSDILGTLLARLPVESRSRVRFDLPPDAPRVDADFAQLVRAMANIVENALAYSPAGEPVDVRVRRIGEAVEIAVEDRGPGVLPGERETIFERFQRGSASADAPGGTGLGLAIAAGIAASHGGTIRVEDAVPQGARFVVSLPISTSEGART